MSLCAAQFSEEKKCNLNRKSLFRQEEYWWEQSSGVSVRLDIVLFHLHHHLWCMCMYGQLIISQWINRSFPACRRDGFNHGCSSLHCDRWVTTYRIKQKIQLHMLCSTRPSPLEFSFGWNLLHFILDQLWRSLDAKSRTSVFLPTSTPHGIRTLFHIDYIWCHSERECGALGTRIRTTFNQISGWPPPLTSVRVPETLCTLWSLSNPVSVGLTQRWSGSSNPPMHSQ